MRQAGRIKSIFRALTWCCVVTLAILSLLPADELVRSGWGGHIEHFGAYAGSAGVAMIGYGQRYRSSWIILVSFCAYAGVLECLQHYSPGRTPAFNDFAASALGALAGILVMLLLRLRYPNLLVGRRV
jgi:VanZ family protein